MLLLAVACVSSAPAHAELKWVTEPMHETRVAWRAGYKERGLLLVTESKVGAESKGQAKHGTVATLARQQRKGDSKRELMARAARLGTQAHGGWGGQQAIWAKRRARSW